MEWVGEKEIFPPESIRKHEIMRMVIRREREKEKHTHIKRERETENRDRERDYHDGAAGGNSGQEGT